VFLPVIAIAEIEFGMMLSSTTNEAQKKDLRDFFTQYPLHLPIDDNTIEPYAMLRAQLWRAHGTRKRRGYKEKVPEDLAERVSGRSLGIDERDLLIASIAVQYNLVLATNDRNIGMQRIEESARQLEMVGTPVHLRIEYWPNADKVQNQARICYSWLLPRAYGGDEGLKRLKLLALANDADQIAGREAKSAAGLGCRVPWRITPTTVAPVWVRMPRSCIVWPSKGLSGGSDSQVKSRRRGA
jgi:predicted nucleic acid-binding protein